MIELLEKWDQSIFQWLNAYHSPILDTVMWHVSGKWEWIPFYLILLYLLVKTYQKQVWIPLLGVGCLIVLADQSSVHLFKEVFQRYRPCHNLELKELVHIVNGKCGGKYGFVSSHAANTFALATYLLLLLKNSVGKKIYLLLLWATIVAYSRVYLGVHYPADIIGGALLGAGIAWFVAAIVKKGLILKK